LIISGFLTSQAREVTEAARAAGFHLDRFLRRGKWVAAAGKLRG
jgi:ribosomal protein L11 methylase PrmA